MVRIPATHPPNKNKLPPLLDPECEARRLKSIKERQDELNKQNRISQKAKDTFERISRGEIK